MANLGNLVHAAVHAELCLGGGGWRWMGMGWDRDEMGCIGFLKREMSSFFVSDEIDKEQGEGCFFYL